MTRRKSTSAAIIDNLRRQLDETRRVNEHVIATIVDSHNEILDQQAAQSPSSQQVLISEHAAILKVLLAANSVTMTVEDLEGKLRMSDKTIRKWLQELRSAGLVYEPKSKKGYALTPKGLARAGTLAPDDGKDFLEQTFSDNC
jgi:biotin operon repressor